MGDTARIAGIVEKHLGPDASDVLFAKAMTYDCDGFPPDCSFYHTCLQGGDCFRKRPHIAAAKLIEKLAISHEGVIKTALLSAANGLRTGVVDIRNADVISLF